MSVEEDASKKSHGNDGRINPTDAPFVLIRKFTDSIHWLEKKRKARTEEEQHVADTTASGK